MNIIFLIIGVFAFAANSLTIRAFQLKCSERNYNVFLFQTFFCIIGALAYFISGSFLFNLSLFQFFSAMLFGMFFASAVLFSAECYLCGPMSLTSVIVNSSVVIPIIYSCLLLKEDITAFQTAGIILLLLTFVLSSLNSEGTGKKQINFKWLIFVLIAFISNGITAVIQKSFKMSAPASDGNIFMGVAYLTAASVLLISFFIKKPQKKRATSFPVKKFPVAFILALIAGLGSFIGNGILMKLSAEIPAALLYPFINGGLCTIVSIFSILFFKEKIEFRKGLTIITGLIAVIILNF